MKILIDVDTQKDFMMQDGSLYVEAPLTTWWNIGDNLENKNYDVILGSVDSHSYDAWEFQKNGGPHPEHCVKGKDGWLRLFQDLPSKIRFIPMSKEPLILGESEKGMGLRHVYSLEIVEEALNKVGIYFEKEVYSLFSNPIAKTIIEDIVETAAINGHKKVTFDVMGYCLGGYCVDAAVEGLLNLPWNKNTNLQMNVRVLTNACAAIGGDEGMLKSKERLTALGAEWVE